MTRRRPRARTPGARRESRVPVLLLTLPVLACSAAIVLPTDREKWCRVQRDVDCACARERFFGMIRSFDEAMFSALPKSS